MARLEFFSNSSVTRVEFDRRVRAEGMGLSPRILIKSFREVPFCVFPFDRGNVWTKAAGKQLAGRGV